jgi:hypothetical protein
MWNVRRRLNAVGARARKISRTGLIEIVEAANPSARLYHPQKTEHLAQKQQQHTDDIIIYQAVQYEHLG